MTFESEDQRGYLLLLLTYMVAAGELCCLSDNSGYTCVK